METSKPIAHVEVCLLPTCTLTVASAGSVQLKIRQVLRRMGNIFGEQTITEFQDPSLSELVKSIYLSQSTYNPSGSDNGQELVQLSWDNIRYHFYHLNDDGPSSEGMAIEGDGGEGTGDVEEVAVMSQWILPSTEFHGLWENLIYETSIKSKLLNYVSSAMLFSDKKVDSNIITWNRVVLLHGPPGTGKTSLCRALAQKLSIRLRDRYKYGHLIEVNSHSLFSKWFSESGKLVMKTFQAIKAIVDDSDALVILLIDEVESLTHARKSAMAGTDPSDAIRVVNALLTQIDTIRRYPNVLILTTSNMTAAIDLAFVDRADIKQYIGLPSAKGIFQIYESCIKELMRAGIISPIEVSLNLHSLNLVERNHQLSGMDDVSPTRFCKKLQQIAEQSVGLSGRTLRRIPMLTHALFICSSTVTLEDFLVGLEKAVQRQLEEQKEFEVQS